MNKIEPAVLTIPVNFTLTPGVQEYTLDLSQAASLCNRRFYRQGLNWAVAGFKVRVVGTGLGTVAVSKLPSTWVLGNSWVKGFKTWQEMNNKALEEAEGAEGRFLDFKIYADSVHHSAGFASNLMPAYTPAPALGEWIPSEIRLPHAGLSTAYEFVAVGDNYPGPGASGTDAVSLIQGYANSRALPAVIDPNTPTELIDASGVSPQNWMSASSNEGTTQDSGVLDDVSAYDQPPYPYENDGVHVTTLYPGGADQFPGLQLHDATDITATTISGTSYLKGGNFPCGLVRFSVVNSQTVEDLQITILVDLVPGNHRGYLCESMMEF